MAYAVLWLLASYLIGAIPTSYLVVRVFKGIDLREHGSRNLGATNLYRTLGWRYAVPVGLFDVAKGAIPVLVFVREQKPSVPVGPIAGMRAGWSELFVTLKSLRQYKTIALFLAAYWLYIDGVNTVIKMAVDYGLSLGFEASSLIVALLITQFVGFPAAIAFGWLGKRFGPKGAIQAAIFVYFCITIWAYWLDNVREFYAMAIAIGLVQGGVQSLSRSLYGRLVPPHKAGEFFGFYNMMGKFAAVIGPVLTGMVALATGSSRLAILSLVILFALGSLLLHRVRLPVGEWGSGSSKHPGG